MEVTCCCPCCFSQKEEKQTNNLHQEQCQHARLKDITRTVMYIISFEINDTRLWIPSVGRIVNSPQTLGGMKLVEKEIGPVANARAIIQIQRISAPSTIIGRAVRSVHLPSSGPVTTQKCQGASMSSIMPALYF